MLRCPLCSSAHDGTGRFHTSSSHLDLSLPIILFLPANPCGHFFPPCWDNPFSCPFFFPRHPLFGDRGLRLLHCPRDDPPVVRRDGGRVGRRSRPLLRPRRLPPLPSSFQGAGLPVHPEWPPGPEVSSVAARLPGCQGPSDAHAGGGPQPEDHCARRAAYVLFCSGHMQMRACYSPMHTHICACTHPRPHTCTCVHAHAHTQTHTHLHAAHSHMYALALAPTHTPTHTLMHKVYW